MAQRKRTLKSVCAYASYQTSADPDYALHSSDTNGNTWVCLEFGASGGATGGARARKSADVVRARDAQEPNDGLEDGTFTAIVIHAQAQALVLDSTYLVGQQFGHGITMSTAR
jgi:hypothetical protein